MNECIACMNPLFRWERLELCHLCRESDMADFEDLITLGRIGLCVRSVVIEPLQAVRF